MPIEARGYEQRRLRLIAEEVGDGPILDIGHAQLPNPYLDPSRCTGFDWNRAEDCDYAEQVQGDIEEITILLSGRTFGTIIAAEFIEHLERPYDVLRMLRTMLAPGAFLILSTPSPVAFPTLLCEWARTRRFFYTSEHTYYFAPRWMERMLEFSGYRVEKVKATGLWPFSFVPAPVFLSYEVIYVARPDQSPAQRSE